MYTYFNGSVKKYISNEGLLCCLERLKWAQRQWININVYLWNKKLDCPGDATIPGGHLHHKTCHGKATFVSF